MPGMHRPPDARLAQCARRTPDIAFVAALHALTLTVFYHYGSDTCLELGLKSVGFSAQTQGLNDSAIVASAHRRAANSVLHELQPWSR